MLECLPILALVIQLDADLGQRQMITATETRGPTIQTYVNPTDATWTLVAVSDGNACVLATGTNMRIILNAD